MRTLLCKNPLGFVIGRKTVEGRFDVNYYKPEYMELIERLENSPFEIKRLGDIASLSSERWERPESGTFRYIEINDIDTFSAQVIQAKELNVEDAPSRAQMVVKKDDIIVSTTRPYRGAVALITEEYNGCVCSTGFAVISAVIRKVKTEVNLKYLLYILHSKFGLKQMEQRMTGGNYPAITPDELLKIWVPTPPIDIQNRIVEIMEKALKEKRESEKEAETLLNSIEDYLLKELGIALPEFEEKSPLIYTVGVKYLKKRWDVQYWSPKYTLIEKAIEKSKYKLKELREVCEINNGVTPPKETYSDNGAVIIKVVNLKDWSVSWDQLSFVPFDFYTKSKKAHLKKFDILMLSSAHQAGHLGEKVVIVDSIPDEFKNKCMVVGEIIIIRSKTDIVNPYYLLPILKLKINSFLLNREVRGQSAHLYPKDIGKLKVPIPNRLIQDKIAEEIKNRIEKAKRLRKEGKQIVEKAKEKIEKIILGEEKT